MDADFDDLCAWLRACTADVPGVAVPLYVASAALHQFSGKKTSRPATLELLRQAGYVVRRNERRHVVVFDLSIDRISDDHTQ